MDCMESVSFQIISFVGAAKGKYVAAITKAREGLFEEAEALIKEGEDLFKNGHHAHFSLIQEEASGHPVTPSIMLMHAEDQLIQTDGFKLLAEEFIRIYKMVHKKESREIK